MNIRIWSIIITLIVVSLLLWANEQLVSDAQVQKVVRVLIVVLFVLYIVGLLTGAVPRLTFS